MKIKMKMKMKMKMKIHLCPNVNLSAVWTQVLGSLGIAEKPPILSSLSRNS
jgi:hypothetical protein